MFNLEVASLESVPTGLRQFYEEQDAGFVVKPELRELFSEYADKATAIETAHALHMQQSDAKIASLKAQLGKLKGDSEFDDALLAARVPAKWHPAVKATLSGKLQEGQSIEGLLRDFINSDEGEAFRGKHETAPHFSARLTKLSARP